MKRVLIVSPHRDDAAFSCAIAIKWFSPTCQVTVANYFTVSEYAPYRTNKAGTVTDVRLKEDLAFASRSGASLDDLALTDAPERLGIQIAGISTDRPLSHLDAHPRHQIEVHIRNFGADLVLAPLAIGDHIDHRIAKAGAVDSAGACIGFYEDLPYAARNPELRVLELVASTGMNLRPWIARLDEGVAWKRSCACLYRSQISPETAEEIALYGARYENGERYWMAPEAIEFVLSLNRE